MPGTLLQAGDVAMNKTGRNSVHVDLSCSSDFNIEIMMRKVQ